MIPHSTADPPTDPPDRPSSSPAAATSPEKKFPPGRETSAPNPEGRPRVLTQLKRCELVKLIVNGCRLEHAAKHAGCSVRTIRREMKRDLSFADEIRSAQKSALIEPLQAVLYSAHEDWRAAKWYLEHRFPEQFARRPHANGFGKRHAGQLLKEVLQIVSDIVIDPNQLEQIDTRIRVTFEYLMQVHCAPKRTTAGLLRAIEFFEQKDRQRHPFFSSDMFTPKSNTTNGPPRASAHTNPPNPKSGPANHRPREPEKPFTLTGILQELIDECASKKKPSASPRRSAKVRP